MHVGDRRWALRVGLLVAVVTGTNASRAEPIIGLDHIPVAVHDLEEASATYRAFGFVLKPGREHANGIRNAHVKFPGGAGIELLTAPKAADGLSAHYVTLLGGGEGPAFVAFHARDTERLHAALRKGGYGFRQNRGTTEFRAPEFGYVFVLRDNRSPSDRPEHFAHANTATALGTVWIAPEDGDDLVRFLVQLGGQHARRSVLAPDPVEATVVTLSEGEVFILPKQRQVAAGRPVIGASFRVADLGTVQETLARARITPWTDKGIAERVVVDPKMAHGLWLEFRR